MAKWSYFSMGIMAGIIAVLLTVVVMQNREPIADAAMPATPPFQTADNNGQGLMLATGGATSQQQDILWVIYKRPAPRKAGADSKDITAKDERITVGCYQVQTGGRQMKLVAVRDISFDLDVLEWMNDKPHVKEIVEDLRKAQPREK